MVLLRRESVVRVLLEDFKRFVLRGNVLDLAVALILGLAFGTIVTAFTDGVLMAFVAAVFGEPNFDSLTWTVGDGVIRYGALVTAVINFVVIAFALFVIIKVFEQLQSRRRRGGEPVDEAELSDEALLLMEIRDLLRAQRDQA